MREYKAQFFRALAHPLRIQILELLRTGPLSVGELQARTGGESTNLSQQLAVLRKERIVYGRKRGTSVFYEVTDPLLFDVLDASRKMFLNQVEGMQTVITESDAADAPGNLPSPRPRDREAF